MPSYAAIAPIAQHRGREPQLACDLDQRPTAARQQGDRLHLELIRKMTPFLAHSTPSRSPRSLAKVSTNSGEAQMIDRAINAGVPFAWVTADTVYGTGAVEMALRHAGKGYVLGVSATSQFNSWGAKPPVAGTATEIASTLDPSAWQRLSAGAGAQGERLFD